MARWYGGRRDHSRRWIYVISALLIIAAVFAYIYKLFPFGREGTVDTAGPAGGETTTPRGEVVEPRAVSNPAAGSEFTQHTAEDNPSVGELISEAMSYINAKPARIIDAREKLNEALALPMSRRQFSVVKQQLTELADKWLFSRTIFPADKLTGSYKVSEGELLSAIGRQFKVPYEALVEINKMGRPEALQAGQTIKVLHGPFNVRVYRSAFAMDLYLQNTFVRSFPVGLGKSGMETPTGLWAVKEGGKMIAPRWTDPISGRTYEAEDPDYPLGSRWVGLEGIKGDAVGRAGFAIHGTKDPNGIGAASSQGCIRLHNGDAILVYNLLEPGQSQVEVVE